MKVPSATLRGVPTVISSVEVSITFCAALAPSPQIRYYALFHA
jgi:hypothetical protein